MRGLGVVLLCLALLYGDGDFQRTLDYSSGMGFDADNQAATMSGLLGIIHGTAGIPEDLLYPLGKDEWQLPFNDRYVNVTRHDLPDASIKDLAARTAALGEKIIQDGKEAGQGVGYLEDGTMVVVEGGHRLINQSLDVVVTKVLQTTAGRMIFAKR